jgi:hypothetical protein
MILKGGITSQKLNHQIQGFNVLRQINQQKPIFEKEIAFLPFSVNWAQYNGQLFPAKKRFLARTARSLLFEMKPFFGHVLNALFGVPTGVA